jgi:hypothetical protein
VIVISQQVLHNKKNPKINVDKLLSDLKVGFGVLGQCAIFPFGSCPKALAALLFARLAH